MSPQGISIPPQRTRSLICCEGLIVNKEPRFLWEPTTPALPIDAIALWK